PPTSSAGTSDRTPFGLFHCSSIQQFCTRTADERVGPDIRACELRANHARIHGQPGTINGGLASRPPTVFHCRRPSLMVEPAGIEPASVPGRGGKTVRGIKRL